MHGRMQRVIVRDRVNQTNVTPPTVQSVPTGTHDVKFVSVRFVSQGTRDYEQESERVRIPRHRLCRCPLQRRASKSGRHVLQLKR